MASPAAKRREERVKLFASALSNIGVATIVTGIVGPSVLGRFQLGIALLTFFVGFGLHLAAQAVLHYVVSGQDPDGAPRSSEDRE